MIYPSVTIHKREYLLGLILLLPSYVYIRTADIANISNSFSCMHSSRYFAVAKLYVMLYQQQRNTPWQNLIDVVMLMSALTFENYSLQRNYIAFRLYYRSDVIRRWEISAAAMAELNSFPFYWWWIEDYKSRLKKISSRISTFSSSQSTIEAESINQICSYSIYFFI